MTIIAHKMDEIPTVNLRTRLQALSKSFKGLAPRITTEHVNGMLQLSIQPEGLAWNWSKHFNYSKA